MVLVLCVGVCGNEVEGEEDAMAKNEQMKSCAGSAVCMRTSYKLALASYALNHTPCLVRKALVNLSPTFLQRWMLGLAECTQSPKSDRFHLSLAWL